MGSVVSQEVYSVLEEDPSRSPKSNLRTLPSELDPRSPTVGVDRTPIQFAATPVPLIDPRSPSFGIERTPIYPLDSSDGSSVDLMSVEEDCGQPKGKALVVPFNLMDAEEDSAVLEGTDALVPLPLAPIIDLSESVLPQRMAFQEVQELPLVTSTNTEIKSEFVKLPTAKAPCDFPKVRPLRPLVPHRISASPRSPLGARNVDSGSLRSMVQLKEARKAESLWNSKSPADSLRLRNNSSSVDKENL